MPGDPDPDLDRDRELTTRSIKTLAWIGDAWLDLEVRLCAARLGDHPLDRLDRARAALCAAEHQASWLDALDAELDDDERSVVRRARNAARPARSRHLRDTKRYRAATAFEALVAWWALRGAEGRHRLEVLIRPRITEALAARLGDSGGPG